ncbi:MAG: hypothetical protein HYZ75_06580 [Elusimicrobia bacterium]|nr:hypothetical protein [Elusimicrobiota bacterium]
MTTATRKTFLTTLAASILVVSPGPLALRAAAQAFARAASVPVAPVAAGLGAAGAAGPGVSPLSAPRPSSLPSLSVPLSNAAPHANAAVAAPSAFASAPPAAAAVLAAAVAPSLQTGPISAQVDGARPVAAPEAAVPVAARGLTQAVQTLASPGASASESELALDTLFTGRVFSPDNIDAELPGPPTRRSGLNGPDELARTTPATLRGAVPIESVSVLAKVLSLPSILDNIPLGAYKSASGFRVAVEPHFNNEVEIQAVGTKDEQPQFASLFFNRATGKVTEGPFKPGSKEYKLIGSAQRDGILTLALRASGRWESVDKTVSLGIDTATGRLVFMAATTKVAWGLPIGWHSGPFKMPMDDFTTGRLEMDSIP